MPKRIAWILASIFALMIAAPDSSAFGGFAFAAPASKGKAQPKAKPQVTQDNADALSAFMSSPIFTRVAATVPSAVEAGPVFPLRGGLICQRMTQTIKIDGQNVHASALMCRHPNGVWKIAVPPDAQDAAKRGTAPTVGPPRPDTKTAVGSRSSAGSPIAKAE